MKKLILILVLGMMYFMSQAQTATINLAGNTMWSYQIPQTCTNTTANEFWWNINTSSPVSISFSALLTKGTGSQTDMLVELYGRCFPGDAWVFITSTTCGTISTTYNATLVVPNQVLFRYFKTVFTGTGTGTTTITNQNFKFWQQ